MSAKKRSIGLVTYSGLPQLSSDDRLLQAALVERGFLAEPLVWDDPGVDWPRFDLCVIRSTWDYHHRHAEFLQWVERVNVATELWNPARVLRWNSHKGYLRDLAEKGIPIVPTAWFTQDDSVDLAQFMEANGWDRAVIKPAVSASAHATVLVSQTSLTKGQAHLDSLLTEGDAMVQPYMASVETYRERSLLFIDGELTHAVRRPPMLHAEPDHSDYGLVTPSNDEVELARDILRVTGYDLLYARVDLVRDDAGEPRLLELELVEPSLFLGLSGAAVGRLVAGIMGRCR